MSNESNKDTVETISVQDVDGCLYAASQLVSRGSAELAMVCVEMAKVRAQNLSGDNEHHSRLESLRRDFMAQGDELEDERRKRLGAEAAVVRIQEEVELLKGRICSPKSENQEWKVKVSPVAKEFYFETTIRPCRNSGIDLSGLKVLCSDGIYYRAGVDCKTTDDNLEIGRNYRMVVAFQELEYGQ